MITKYVLTDSSESNYLSKLELGTPKLTESINRAKSFPCRKIADKFLLSNHLTEAFSVRCKLIQELTESVNGENPQKEIESALNDLKDVIDTTIDYIDLYSNQLNEDEAYSNVEEILKKLKKMRKYAVGIAFYPSFINLDCTHKKEETPTPNQSVDATPEVDAVDSDTSK